MSDVTNEAATNEAGEKTNGTAQAVKDVAAAQRVKVRQVISTLKRHPLGFVLAVGAAAALIEVELAVGILTGIGATALLATKSGPEARQEVVAKGQEVVAKGKAAFERARVALASRTRAAETAAPDEASAAAAQPPAPPAA
jgi:hypothetical protein